jgi:hypothetical protein
MSTLTFDHLRDIKCNGTCCHSVTLKEKPDYILDKNWKVIFLSYNYALFYGAAASILFSLFVDPEYHYTAYFLFISFVQRVMCAFVMNGIHRNTNSYVHAGYYSCYFTGSIILLEDYITIYITTHVIAYIIMCIVSVMSSVAFIHLRGKQYDYSWRKQYSNGQLINVELRHRNNAFYDQPYSKFEYFHLRLILVLNIFLYFTVS